MALATEQDSNIYLSSREARIDFECSGCGGRLSVKSSKVGSRGPFCGGAVQSSHSRSQTLAVTATTTTTATSTGAANRGFQANRIITPSSGHGADSSWRQRYGRQKRRWMRRRWLEKRIERFGEALLVKRGRLVVVVVFGMIGAGLLAFGLIASR